MGYSQYGPMAQERRALNVGSTVGGVLKIIGASRRGRALSCRFLALVIFFLAIGH